MTCKVAYTEQPYVRKPRLIKKRLTVLQKPLSTQLAIATAIATAKERIKRLTSKYEAKQMKLASYHWAAEKRARVNRLSSVREKRRKYSSKSSLTSLTTQLAIATRLTSKYAKRNDSTKEITEHARKMTT